MKQWVWVGVLALLSACGTDEPFSRGEPRGEAGSGGQKGGGGGGDGGGDGENGVSFARDVDPILDVKCASCHAGNAGGLTLVGDPADDFQAVSSRVIPGDPDGSLLLGKARGEGHGGGAIISPGQPDYDTIEAWIVEGAANN